MEAGPLWAEKESRGSVCTHQNPSWGGEASVARLEAIYLQVSRPLPATGATGDAWVDIRRPFHRALEAAKLEGLWFHDLRRSFVTRARKHRIPSRW